MDTVEVDRAGGTERAQDGAGLVAAMKALGHPLRFSLMEELSGGERCVCDLVDLTGASQPLVSHHLAILRKAGLIHYRHEATWAYYSIDAGNWRAVQDSIAALQPSGLSAPPCPPGEAEVP